MTLMPTPMTEFSSEQLFEVLTLRHYNTLENSVLTGHHAETVLKPLGLTDDELADLEEDSEMQSFFSGVLNYDRSWTWSGRQS